MKVLNVFDVTIPVIAGYTIRAKYIVNNLKTIGVDPVVISSLRQPNGPAPELGNIDLPAESHNGITYYRSKDFLTLQGKRKNNLPLLRELYEIRTFSDNIEIAIKKSSPELVHAHSPLLVGYAACKAARKHNIPFVYEIRAFWEDAAVDQGKITEKSVRYRLTRYLETCLLKKADAVSVICEGIKKDILERGIPEEKVFVVPNGVDTKKFIPLVRDEALAEKHSIKGKTVIGYIGTLYNFEGIHHLVEAMRLLKGRDNIVCLVIGYGQAEDKVKSLIEKYKLRDRVRFLGKVPHEEINSYYSIIDILVYPRISRRITELVTPLKPLEAMSMEKTVIASDVGGLRELIQDQKDGLLFRADDPKDLKDKILFLIKNKDIARQLGQTARNSMIQKRSWINIVAEYKRIYEYIFSNVKR